MFSGCISQRAASGSRYEVNNTEQEEDAAVWVSSRVRGRSGSYSLLSVCTLSYCALNSPWMRHEPRISSLCFRDASLNVLAELEQEEDQDAVIWFCLVSLCETIIGSQLRVLCILQIQLAWGWDH